MRAWLAVLVGLLLAGAQEPPAQAPLVEPLQRQKLHAVTGEIARCGAEDLVARMGRVLAALGDEEQVLERATRGWERTLAGARPAKRARAAAAGKLKRELVPLVRQLEHESEPQKSELARCILELDSDEPAARAALGHTRASDGTWASAEQHAWRLGAERIAGLGQDAAALAIEIEHGVSQNPVVREVLGGGRFVRAGKVELHGRRAPQKLERILRQGLRAAAFSHAILEGSFALPESSSIVVVLLDSEEVYQPAIEEAHAAQGISDLEYGRVKELDLRSFEDARGWRTSRWRSETDCAALVLWLLLPHWMPANAQPCLRVGHLNWVTLSFLGATMPLTVWSQEDEAAGGQFTSATPQKELLRQALWRSTRQSLWGTRAWMIGQVRAQRDPPWARAMLEQDGQIRDAALLKTTLVCEFLQQEGSLTRLIESTSGAGQPARAFEEALGEPLPDFEQRWRRWLDPREQRGVLQELGQESDAAAASEPFAEALRLLNQTRSDALQGQHAEILVVALDEDLCRAAAAHARYLTLNGEQKHAWPDAHHETPDTPGFSPAGALSGSRSVIAYSRDPKLAVRDWLGTFYHRLPLLDPGLFGVGIGTSEEVVVLDAGSLVLAPWKDHAVLWPVPEATDVPRGFRPEMPNPVPGVEQDGLGTCVSVQLFFANAKREHQLTLELFTGEPLEKNRVECHVLSPDAPLQVEHAPPNAWGLLPKRELARKTLYTARARWANQERTWSFTTGG